MTTLNHQALLAQDPLAEILPPLSPPLPTVTTMGQDGLSVEHAHVMIVDDEPINIKLVRKVLKDAGFTRFTEVTDSRDALATMRQAMPDILLLDIMMPHVDGLEILEAAKATEALSQVPVLILTASSDRQTKLEALELGALDFLAKPVDRMELVPRVRNTIAIKAYQDQLKHHSANLEAEVERRTREVLTSRLEVVHCLGRAAEYHDDITGRHVIRVGMYAGLIAREMGLNESQVHVIQLAAQLHDIGKLGVSQDILQKEGKLTPKEYYTVQAHCVLGKEIFDRVDESKWKTYEESGGNYGNRLLDHGHSPLLRVASRIALTHHEHFDGNGYPIGLAGNDIPLEGRITAVADVFDALSCRRPYKPAYGVEKCFQILAERRGTQFDPDVLDAFMRCREEVIETRIQHADTQ